MKEGSRKVFYRPQSYCLHRSSLWMSNWLANSCQKSDSHRSCCALSGTDFPHFVMWHKDGEKKKEFFLMQPKLEEYCHSSWNLATKSCLQSSKFTTLARFNASEGFKPSKCFLATWSHIHHAGLAPSQPGPVVCSRLPVAAEPSVCPFHAVTAWDRGNNSYLTVFHNSNRTLLRACSQVSLS